MMQAQTVANILYAGGYIMHAKSNSNGCFQAEFVREKDGARFLGEDCGTLDVAISVAAMKVVLVDRVVAVMLAGYGIGRNYWKDRAETELREVEDTPFVDEQPLNLHPSATESPWEDTVYGWVGEKFADAPEDPKSKLR